jgi:hypothetical protein
MGWYASAIWGSSASDVWAEQDNTIPLTDGGVNSQEFMWHWDGTHWTNYPAPFLNAQAISIAGTSANDVWVLDSNGNVGQFCGTSWSSRGNAGVGIGSIVPTSTDVWAIGFDTNLGMGRILRLR